MKKFLGLLITLITFGALMSQLQALPPNQAEMNAKQQFLSTRFDLTQPKDQLFGLQVIANNDPVLKNTRAEGNALRIANQVFEKGLYCHANSHVNVFLGKPVKKLTAVIGVDHNKNNNLGSVQFLVKVQDQVKYKSEILHGAEEGVPIDVALDGADSFSLLINDGGDGIACDQANWADARVEYEDGTEEFLSNLPFVDGQQDSVYDNDYPFSFVYKGESSRTFLKDWSCEKSERDIDETRSEITYTFQEPGGPLQVRCVVTNYKDFPHVEWILYFKNCGTENTPILEEIQPLDLTFSKMTQTEMRLHYSVGSPYRPDDYMPLEKTLTPKTVKEIKTFGGRPTNDFLPNFNLETEKGHGYIVVFGWPGQWATHLDHFSDDQMKWTGGQELTHFTLYPDEEVRSPLVVFQPWFRTNWIEAQNVWRAWMLKYNVPRQNGHLVEHHTAACSSHFYVEMTQADAASQMMFIDRYLEEKIPLDYWWMDAGWYSCEDTPFPYWPQVGTWEPDPKRFPNGLREVTDHGRSKGVKSIVWCEPERAMPGSWIDQEHPEYLFILPNVEYRLFRLNNPEAWNWLVDHFDRLIKDQGIDLYRQDYNLFPLDYWRADDTPDRQGITEIQCVTGYLAYWDELLRRNPGLRIDSCATGGRRNDLETMRRAVPLLRSDYILEAISQQVHSYGISLWIPLYGTAVNSQDDYGMRSCFVPYFNLCYDMRNKDNDYDTIRKNLKIWEEYVVPNYCGDYYPLTSVDTKNDSWCGWQYNSPEKGTGVIMMFRRDKSICFAVEIPLFGLNDDATYEFKDIDTGETWQESGYKLRTQGQVIQIENRPGVKTMTYKKVQ